MSVAELELERALFGQKWNRSRFIALGSGSSESTQKFHLSLEFFIY